MSEGFSTWLLDYCHIIQSWVRKWVQFIKLPELPALPFAEGHPGLLTCISNCGLLQCNENLSNIKMNAYLGYMSIISEKKKKKEVSRPGEDGVLSAVVGKARIMGESPFFYAQKLVFDHSVSFSCS